MNAGAYGGEMKDVLKSVTVADGEGNIIKLSADELNLGYRTSIVKTAGYLVLEAEISLKEGIPEEIKALMKDLTERRTSKQPLEFPSAGSTFKRPEGYFAGKLIMDSGLRGYRVGGAQVSEKHCGFVINAGGATAADVRALIQDVQNTVYEKFGGAGGLVPITGFANSVASSAIEFQAEGQVFGIGCKIFTIAGPVILYGLLSSWILGIFYYILKLMEVIS